MKKGSRLSRYFSIVLGVITLVMIVVYSILVQYSLFSGMEETISYGLHLRARDFVVQYQKNPLHPLPEAKNMKSYIGETDLPKWVKTQVHPQTLSHGEMKMADLTVEGFNDGKSFLYIVFPYDLPDGNRLYQVEIFREQDEIEGTFLKSKQTGILTLVIGVGFILTAFMAVRFLFKKVSTPVEDLLEWAGALTGDKLGKPRPDFKFDEIDHLADLIENAVSDLHSALKREHDFLSSASHELRTPIAVLKTNIDLLERLRSNPEVNEKKSRDRIRRAVDNMQNLTVTLLWLGRKNETMPDPEPIRMDCLLEEIIQDNQYLLTGKNVDLEMNTGSFQVTFPRTALHIALNNLVRNAFQHTVAGKIDIRLSERTITITNTNNAEADQNTSGNDYGFGLGLMLVEQICEKLNIAYATRLVSKGHQASLSFPE